MHAHVITDPLMTVINSVLKQGVCCIADDRQAVPVCSEPTSTC